MFRFWFSNLGRAEIAVVAIAGGFMFLISCSVGPGLRQTDCRGSGRFLRN